MMCEFQSLYYGDDGYVVRCNHCRNYQFAYLSTMLTINADDFKILLDVVKKKCSEEDHSFAEHSKCVIIPTPSNGIFMLLTRNEAIRFYNILEEADNEEKALNLLSLFNQ